MKWHVVKTDGTTEERDGADDEVALWFASPEVVDVLGPLDAAPATFTNEQIIKVPLAPVEPPLDASVPTQEAPPPDPVVAQPDADAPVREPQVAWLKKHKDKAKS